MIFKNKKNYYFLLLIILQIFSFQLTQSFEHQQGYDNCISYGNGHALESSTTVGRSETCTVNFSSAFSETPQVIITPYQMDYLVDAEQSFIAEITSVSTTGFDFVITSEKPILFYVYQFRWIGIVDQNFRVSFKEWKKSVTNFPVFYDEPLNCFYNGTIKGGAFFLGYYMQPEFAQFAIDVVDTTNPDYMLVDITLPNGSDKINFGVFASCSENIEIITASVSTQFTATSSGTVNFVDSTYKTQGVQYTGGIIAANQSNANAQGFRLRYVITSSTDNDLNFDFETWGSTVIEEATAVGFLYKEATCENYCQNCSGGSNSNCAACESPYVLSSNSCVCPDGYYEETQVCYQCLNGCQTCTNGSSCTQCIDSTPPKEGSQCECPFGYRIDISDGSCIQWIEVLSGEENGIYWQSSGGHTLQVDSNSGRYVEITVPFGETFSNIPKVILSVHFTDYQDIVEISVDTTLESVSTTEFTFRATSYSVGSISSHKIRWIAINDMNFEVKYQHQQTESSSQTVNFDNPITCLGGETVVGGAYFLGMLSPASQREFSVEVIETNSNYIKVDTSTSTAATWVSFVVFGSCSDNMEVFQASATNVDEDYLYQENFVYTDSNIRTEGSYFIGGLSSLTLSDPTAGPRSSYRYNYVRNTELRIEIGTWQGVSLSIAKGYSFIFRRAQCDTNCTACSGTPQNCTACIDGYFVNGGNSCEICDHSVCGTCVTSNSNCVISCNTNCDGNCQLNGDCTSCLDEYYLDNGECLDCLSGCQTCSDGSSCDSCKTSTNPARLTGQNCECPEKYYDDGVDDQCQLCNDACYSCTDGTTNCTQSCSHRCVSCHNGSDSDSCDTCQAGRGAAPDCECPIGQYDVIGNPACQQCDDSCFSCVDQADNCILACAFRCATCQGQQNEYDCLTCRGDRSGDFCLCPDGQFDDEQSENCVDCDDTCVRCNINECQECEGDLENDQQDPTICVCPDGQVLTPNTYLCQSCQLVIISAILSDDLKYIIIDIDFDLEVIGFQGDETQYSSLLCQHIFEEDTINKIDVQSRCKFETQSQIVVETGINVTFQQNYPMQFKTNALIIDGCTENYPITTFQTPEINNPASPLIPQMKIIGPTTIVSLCQNVYLNINEIKNTGNREYGSITWSVSNDVGGNLISQNLQTTLDQTNQKKSLLLEIEPFVLIEYSDYTFKFQVTTFYGTVGEITIDFSTAGTTGLESEIVQTEPFIFVVSQVIFFKSYFKFLECSGGGSVEAGVIDMDIRWEKIAPNGDVTVLYEGLSVSDQTSTSIKLDPYTHDIEQNYEIKVSFSSQNPLIQQHQIAYYYIEKQEILAYIEGGNRENGYNSELNLLGVTKDFNQPPQQQGLGFTISWECISMSDLEPCQSINQQQITFVAGEYEQSFPEKTFEPYNSFKFILNSEKGDFQKSSEAIINVVETNLPSLTVIVPQSFIQNTKVNMNDDIEVEFIIDENPDDVFMSLIFFYDLDIVATKSFRYTKFKFKIWDLFSNYSVENPELLVRFTLYNPKYFMPSQANFPVTLNIPPTGGTFDIVPLQGSPLTTDFTITATNYKDVNAPLSYQFAIYLDPDQFEKEKEIGAFPTNSPKYFLTDYQSPNEIISILPQGKYNENTQETEILVFVSISDALGGLYNTTQTVEITPVLDFSVTLTSAQNRINTIENSQGSSKVIQYSLLGLQLYQVEEFNVQSACVQNGTWDNSLGKCTCNNGFYTKSCLANQSQYDDFKDLKQQVYEKLQELKPLTSSKILSDTLMKVEDILMQGEDSVINNLDNNDIDNFMLNIQNIILIQTNIVQDLENEKQFNPGDSQLLREQTQSSLLLGIQSSLLDVMMGNLGKISSNRILTDSEIAQQKNQIYDLTKNLSNGLLAGTLPNQDSVTYAGKNLYQSTQRQTRDTMINSQFIGSQSNHEYEFENLNDESSQQVDDGENNNQFDENAIYSTANLIFANNPFQNNSDFPYPQQDNKLFDTDIISEEDGENVDIGQNFQTFDFQISSSSQNDSGNSESTFACIAKGSIWENKSCFEIEIETDQGSRIQCQCKTLDPVTIVNDIEGIFKDTNITKIFGNAGLEALADFKFWEALIFYLFLSQTIILCVLLKKGHNKDLIEMEELKSIKQSLVNYKDKEHGEKDVKNDNDDISKVQDIEHNDGGDNIKPLIEMQKNIKSSTVYPDSSSQQESDQQLNKDDSQKTDVNDLKNEDQQSTTLKLNIKDQNEDVQSEKEGSPSVQLVSNKDQNNNEGDDDKSQGSYTPSPSSYQNRRKQNTQVAKSQFFTLNPQDSADTESQMDSNNSPYPFNGKKGEKYSIQDQLYSRQTSLEFKKNQSFQLQEQQQQEVGLEEDEKSLFKNQLRRKKKQRLNDVKIKAILTTKTESTSLQKKILFSIIEKEKREKRLLEKKRRLKEQKQLNKVKKDNQVQVISDGQKNKNNQEKKNHSDSEEHDEELDPIYMEKKDIFDYVLKLHNPIGIYFHYDKKRPRPQRYIFYYIKLCIVLAISSIVTQDLGQYEAILVSVVIAMASGIPLFIIQLMMKKGNIPKIIGWAISTLIAGLCFYAIIVNAALMGVDESNEWTVTYFSSFVTDLVTQIFSNFIYLTLFNWTIGKKGFPAHLQKVLKKKVGDLFEPDLMDFN